jgi:putative salt-induced outer membrane protein
MRKGFLLATALLLSATAAIAQDEAEKKAWSTDIELGFSYQSGNTNEEKLNYRQKIVYDAAPWLNTITLSAKNGSTRVKVVDDMGNTVGTEDQRTDEAYYVTEKLDWFFAEKTYAFFRATWEKDRFNGFDHQASEVLGIGHEFLGTDTLSFKVELGAGARQDELDENLEDSDGNPDPTAGQTTDEAIAYFSDQFVWKFTESAELGQDLSIEYGDDNTVSRFTAYVKTQLAAGLSMKVSYENKYTKVVPDSSHKKDETFLVTLLYSY